MFDEDAPHIAPQVRPVAVRVALAVAPEILDEAGSPFSAGELGLVETVEVVARDEPKNGRGCRARHTGDE